MLQWLDPVTGKRKSKSAETANPVTAEERGGDLEAGLNNGRYVEASRMTWQRFRQVFEAEYLAGVRERTRLAFGLVFDRIERLCSPALLSSVNERMASAFAAAMYEKKAYGKGGYAPNTIRNTLRLLRTALRWAVRQKMLPALPHFPKIKVPKKAPQPIPAESFERLLDKAPDANMRAFLLCGWLAGLRLGEAVALEWEQTDEAPYLDLGRGRIVLPAEFAKADRDQWVPLAAELRQALEALPRLAPRVFHFVNRWGKPILAASVCLRVIALAKQAGVRLTMHSLRKGFGCRYAGKVPAQVLQKLMRHSDINTTMAYYVNVDAAVEAAVRAECNTLHNRNPAEAPAEGKAESATPLPARENGKACEMDGSGS
jgi:integrase